jgi:5,5'-dehydrodivanillate O-demethylase
VERAQRAAGRDPVELAEDVLNGKLRIEDVTKKDPANLKTLTSVEDYVAQVGQGAVANHAGERLGRMDAGILLVRKLWQRELRAMAEGKPMKTWQRTAELNPPPEM